MITRLKNYIQGINLEWQKVTKPDIKEVQGSTITVIVASALLGLFIGLVDGNSAFPAWSSPLSWVVLIALPIVVFFFVKSWENQPRSSREAKASDDDSLFGSEQNRKLVATAIACVPLIAVVVSRYLLNTSLEGFGMAFLRTLFIR
ncbi:preprotein translocase subunit SecE [Candidatus Poribacteria bacterium]|nr:preprotein translocase subunit SecE [Candidatus Poribacteria bacterium]